MMKKLLDHTFTEIIITQIMTPLGKMYAGAVDKGICLLEFHDRKNLQQELEELKRRLKIKIVEGKSPYFALLQTELEAYFKGTGKQFTVPIITYGTPFQQQVWRVLQQIPYGETYSYAQQAKLIGNPKAVRAVALTNGRNRIAVIIPCHRVIGSNGKLVGYAGGMERKEKLLELEKYFKSQCDLTN